VEQGGQVQEWPLHGKAWHGVDAPLQKGSDCLLSRNECNLVRGPHESWARRGRIHQDMERMKGHLRTKHSRVSEACQMLQCEDTGDSQGQ